MGLCLYMPLVANQAIYLLDDSRNFNVQWGSKNWTCPVFEWSTMSRFISLEDCRIRMQTSCYIKEEPKQMLVNYVEDTVVQYE